MFFALRYVFRRLVRAPGYALVVVLSLGAGMASVVAVLTVVDALFFRPPMGVRDPARVVGIGQWVNGERVAYPDYVDLRAAAHAFSKVGAFAVWNYSARVGGDVVPARGLLATYTLLPLLGVQPELGRGFAAREDQPGAQPVLLVSYDFWRQHLGGDMRALGAPIRLAGRFFTVIGVLPRYFTAPDLSPVDLVLPITNAPWFGGQDALTSRDYQWVRLVGRLRGRVTVEEASREATTIYRRANKDVRSVDQTTLGRLIVPVRPIVIARREPNSPSAKVTLWLALLTTVLLLTACANVASVLLARNVRERRDVAVHVALGAANMQLVGRVLMEIALLIAASAVLAVALADRASRMLMSTLLSDTVGPPPLDTRIIVTAAAVAVLAAVLCAIGPVARAFRVDPRADLAAGTLSSTRSQRNAFRLLLIAQLGLGVVLVSQAVLFGASLRNAMRVNVGIDLEHLLVADVDLHAAGLSASAAAAAVQRVLERLSALRGIAAAGLTNAAMVPGFLTLRVSIPGHDLLPAMSAAGAPSVSAVTSGYLDALGVRLLNGRALRDVDFELHRPISLVSDRMARLYWPNENPIGQCIRIGTTAPCAIVVGVVSDRHNGPLDQKGGAEVYVPLGSPAVPKGIAEVFQGREVAVRVRGDPRRMEQAVRTTLLDAVPELTSVRVRTGNEYLDQQFRAWKLGASVLGVFGVLALLLAGIGVFGVSSQSVAQRTRELGVRGALGAPPSRLAALVFLESTRVAAVGVAVGIVAALAATRLTSAIAFGVSPVDPRIYGVAAAALTLITVAATVLPALRGASVDPLVALRNE